jgi:hypothetical protein
MAYWVDDKGELREGDEELGRRYGFREATEDDLLAHNERLDTAAADTKGPLGLIGEGFERGLAHIQEIGHQTGITPPMAGSEAFGPGGGLPSFAPPVSPAPPSGASTFPEATSDEARLRTKAHPVYEGIGTGLATAPFAAIGSAAGGALGAAGSLAAAAGAIGTEAVVEAAAQEYDDAWLEQRPYELKNVAAYTAMFALGDVLLRGVGHGVKRGAGAIGEALGLGSEVAPSPTLGARNIVAEAQAGADKAGTRRPAQSVGAASARDMAEPFDEALSTMTDRDAMVLARDADDHYHLVARDAADELTRIHRGLTESLGNQLKYDDFKIGADAWDNRVLERQSEWIEDMAAQGQEVVNRIEGDTIDYGNAGKLVAKDIGSYSDLIMNEADGAQRNYLVDQLKKRLDKRIMDIAGNYQGDPHARKELLKIIEPFAGGPEVRGMLRDGLENKKFWGHNAELQKALNAPWHDLLTHWRKFQEKLYEASGEVKFAEMGAGRTVMESTAERVLSVLQKDTRVLQDLGQHVAGTFDGYQRLIEARQAKGITGQAALPGLTDSIRNLMEDWNLGATLSVAKARADNAAKNPRNWHLRALELAEKAPFGVGTAVGAARTAGKLAGDLHIKKGTPLADVWDAGLKRYAQNPALGDTAINQAYSDWMQAALRQRGAPIPDRRTAWGGIKDAAGNAGGKVAGASLFGLGAAATQQPQQVDENGQPVKQAGAGPLGLMGLGLAMMFKGKARSALWHEAEKIAYGFPKGARAIADAALEGALPTIRAAAKQARESTTDVIRADIDRIVEGLTSQVTNDPRVMEKAGHFLTDDPQGEFRQYLQNMVESEFAGMAPRHAPAVAPRVSGVLDIGMKKDPTKELADLLAASHQAQTMGDWTAALTQAKNTLPKPHVEALNQAVYEGFGEPKGGTWKLIERELRGEYKDTLPLEQRIGYWIADSWNFAADKLTNLTGKRVEEDTLDEVSRRYISTKIRDTIYRIAEDVDYDLRSALPHERVRGSGVRVLDAMRSGFGDANEQTDYAAMLLRELGPDRGLARLRQLITETAKERSLPSALTEALADDVTEAVRAGQPMGDVVRAIARTMNEGAEATKLTNEQQEQAAFAFEDWARRASERLGYSIRDSIETYAGAFDYKNINAYARGKETIVKHGNEAVENAYEKATERSAMMAHRLQGALDFAIDEGYTSPGVTYRGMLLSDEDLAAIEKAPVVEAHAFMSTTTDADYAWDFISKKKQLRDNPSLNRVLIEVAQKTGVPMNPGEHEVLLRAGTRFRVEPASGDTPARWRLVELDTPPKIPATMGRASPLPWVAGGVFALGSLTAADKAYAADNGEPPTPPPPPDAPDAPDIGPSSAPSVRYREAMRSVASGAPRIIQQNASAALRRNPPRGRDPLRAFSGRRGLDAAVDAARQAVNGLQSDPGALITELGGSTGDLARTHPSVYMALVQKASGIVSYLSANVPPRTGQTLLDPEGMPPSRDRSVDFVYKAVGATKPRRAMRDIASLEAPPEEIESFQQNWPELWEPLRMEMLGQIQRRYEAGRPIDSERLRKLDGLLGMNGQLDPSASAEVAQHIIASADAAPAPAAGKTAPTQAPSGVTGRASGMLQTRLAGLQMESTSG